MALDISNLTTVINAFRRIAGKDEITPENLGVILQQLADKIGEAEDSTTSKAVSDKVDRILQCNAPLYTVELDQSDEVDVYALFQSQNLKTGQVNTRQSRFLEAANDESAGAMSAFHVRDLDMVKGWGSNKFVSSAVFADNQDRDSIVLVLKMSDLKDGTKRVSYDNLVDVPIATTHRAGLMSRDMVQSLENASTVLKSGVVTSLSVKPILGTLAIEYTDGLKSTRLPIPVVSASCAGLMSTALLNTVNDSKNRIAKLEKAKPSASDTEFSELKRLVTNLRLAAQRPHTYRRGMMRTGAVPGDLYEARASFVNNPDNVKGVIISEWKRAMGDWLSLDKWFPKGCFNGNESKPISVGGNASFEYDRDKNAVRINSAKDMDGSEPPLFVYFNDEYTKFLTKDVTGKIIGATSADFTSQPALSTNFMIAKLCEGGMGGQWTVYDDETYTEYVGTVNGISAEASLSVLALEGSSFFLKLDIEDAKRFERKDKFVLPDVFDNAGNALVLSRSGRVDYRYPEKEGYYGFRILNRRYYGTYVDSKTNLESTRICACKLYALRDFSRDKNLKYAYAVSSEGEKLELQVWKKSWRNEGRWGRTVSVAASKRLFRVRRRQGNLTSEWAYFWIKRTRSESGRESVKYIRIK